MSHVRTIPRDDSKDIHRRWCKNSTHPGHPVEMEQGARRVRDTRDGNTLHSRRWPVVGSADFPSVVRAVCVCVLCHENYTREESCLQCLTLLKSD